MNYKKIINVILLGGLMTTSFAFAQDSYKDYMNAAYAWFANSSWIVKSVATIGGLFTLNWLGNKIWGSKPSITQEQVQHMINESNQETRTAMLIAVGKINTKINQELLAPLSENIEETNKHAQKINYIITSLEYLGTLLDEKNDRMADSIKQQLATSLNKDLQRTCNQIGNHLGISIEVAEVKKPKNTDHVWGKGKTRDAEVTTNLQTEYAEQLEKEKTDREHVRNVWLKKFDAQDTQNLQQSLLQETESFTQFKRFL